jgi:hypothetical protein
MQFTHDGQGQASSTRPAIPAGRRRAGATPAAALKVSASEFIHRSSGDSAGLNGGASTSTLLAALPRFTPTCWELQLFTLQWVSVGFDMLRRVFHSKQIPPSASSRVLRIGSGSSDRRGGRPARCGPRLFGEAQRLVAERLTSASGKDQRRRVAGIEGVN